MGVIFLKNIFVFLKCKIWFFVPLICLFFVLVSCGLEKYINFSEKFLSNLKERNLEQSYIHLAEGQELEIFKEYMGVITSLKNVEGEFGALSNLILDKVFGFDYEIMNAEDKDEYMDVNVRVKYSDFSNLYKEALNNFLEKSLDFENLDNLYSGDYIKNILMEHVERTPKQIKDLKFSITKNKNLKIIFTREMLEVFTGNFIDFFTDVSKNILRD